MIILAASVTLALPLFSAAQQAQAPHDMPGHTPSEPHVHQGGRIGAELPSEDSGTTWLPAAQPMRGWHGGGLGWELMGHGAVFAQFVAESGAEHHRGSQAGSLNWAMGMATRRAGAGRLTVRMMLSLEPWTIRGCGYPDLLATGEVCDGDSIHDRQHPHDLFMELAVKYDRPLRRGLRWQVYGGPAGEPALGPGAFPHRASATENPLAPIGHHWLDSSHISFGVITGGIHASRWKAEASLFNGREPDDTRGNLEWGALDSFSARLAIAPTRGLTLQVSAGHLRGAEASPGDQPRSDVGRVTASATYVRAGSAHVWATTTAYGMNSQVARIPQGELPQTTHAALLESSLSLSDRHTWFGRLEIAGKPAHDLHAHEYATLTFIVGKAQLGYIRYLPLSHRAAVGLGASVMASAVPTLLAPRYDGRVAPGGMIFAVVRPARVID